MSLLGSEQTGDQGSGGTIRTVIADDSNVIADILSKFLLAAGRFEIVGLARDGRQAVELARSTLPDLVIMDLNMPTMSGLGATRAIKALDSPPQVVIVSLNDDQPFREAATDAGADGFCSKLNLEAELSPLLDELAV